MGKCCWCGEKPDFFPVDSFNPPLGGGVIHDVLVNEVLCCNLKILILQVPSNIGIVSEILSTEANKIACLWVLFSW